MEQNDFEWLLKWYENHFNGDRKHSEKINISTIDNPGWSVSINLINTELEGKEFNQIKLEISENNWLTCFKKDEIFEGRCGPLNLPQIFEVFRKWADDFEKQNYERTYR